MHRNRDDVSGGRMDELAMASFAGAVLDIACCLQAPDQLTPRHQKRIINPTLGYCQPNAGLFVDADNVEELSVEKAGEPLTPN